MRAATASVQQPRAGRQHRFVPATPPGRWAVGLAVTSLTLLVASSLWSGFVANAGADREWESTLMFMLGAPAFLTGLAVVPTALFAIVRRAERSLLVWLTLVPGAFAVFFVLGELLIGHD